MVRKSIVLLVLLSIFTTNALASSFEGEIKADVKGFNGKVGVYAKNLKTGRTIEFNQEVIFPTASTSKLVVALATYKYLYPGVEIDKAHEYDQEIKLMMTVSDNDSFQELVDEINTNKKDALVKVVKDLRLRQTQIHSDNAFNQYGYHSITTPYEMARVFESIYMNKYLSKEKSELMKNELATSIFHDEIPRYMLTTVFHKVGELDGVLCDVGVVQDGHDPILISFYTDTTDHEYSSNFIAMESAKLYNALRRK